MVIAVVSELSDAYCLLHVVVSVRVRVVGKRVWRNFLGWIGIVAAAAVVDVHSAE